MILNKLFRQNLSYSVFKVVKFYSSSYTPKPLRSLKSKSTRDTVQYYVDYIRVRTVGGNGGNGCVSFLSAWCKEHAGPDGGDGGNGGHVIFKATSTVKALNHCSRHIAAENGVKGDNKDCNGRNAEHTIIPVPIGTIVKNENNQVIGDLHTENMMFLASRGGAGGRGNKFFTTDVIQAPDVAEFGAQGETKTYHLELRSMADIGLIGFPNAGKSTLLRAITRARPKVAPYPFTTLRPHVGIIPYDDYEQIAVADLPGLIPGSHKNRGLGIQFLQHAERCAGLLYILDASEPEPWTQWETLNYELTKFNVQLTNQARYIVANKIDLPEAINNIPKMKEYFKDFELVPISAKTGINIEKLLELIRNIYDKDKLNKMAVL